MKTKKKSNRILSLLIYEEQNHSSAIESYYKTFRFEYSFFLCFIVWSSIVLTSCNQSVNEKKIIGKWEGNASYSCNGKQLNLNSDQGRKLSYEFKKDGICTFNNTSSASNVNEKPFHGTFNYKIVGDSIIWGNKTENVENTFINFKSDTQLFVKTHFSDGCEMSCLLDKKER